MKNKLIFMGTVVIVGILSLLISVMVEPDKIRYHQHVQAATLPPAEEGVDQTLTVFGTHLPLVSIHTNGQVIPGMDRSNDSITAHISIFDKEGEYNHLEDEPVVDTDMKIHIRGHSSRNFPKKGYIVKFLDGDKYKKLGVMGMEEGHSWVFHGPYLDKTLMRNYMWYNISGEIMDWAPDVRFCELLIDGKYQGVYVCTEDVRVGNGRLNLTESSGRGAVTSYVLHMDRADRSADVQLNNFSRYTYVMQSGIEVEYPSTEDLTAEQYNYIEQDLSRFEKALYSFDYDTLKYGYRNYIDVDSFVDYFIINEFTQNYDAGIYSTWLYKDMRGKMKLAVWDFNNSCDNYQEYSTREIGFSMQERVWYEMLFKDEKFVERIIARYRQLRETVLSEEYLLQYIDDTRAYLGDAVERNYTAWDQAFTDLPPIYSLIPVDRNVSDYDAAVSQLKDFIIFRGRWLDRNIETLRQFSHESKNKKFNH